MSKNNISPEVLSELEKQADKAKRSSAAVQERFSREQEKEDRRKQQEHDRKQDDSLSFGDFYRMSSSVLSHPSALWSPLALGIFGPATYFGFDIDRSGWFQPALDGSIQSYLLVYAACVLAIYLVILPLPLLRASRMRSAFSRLSFRVKGLGQLIHRNNEPLLLNACSIEIIIDKQLYANDPATAGSLQKTVMKLITEKMNTALSRFARSAEGFDSLKWRVVNDTAKGFANHKIAGKLMSTIISAIAPLQAKSPFIRQVVITVHNEQVDVSDD